MKCPKCHTENPDTRKFCRLNLPSEPAPKDLSFDEKIAKIQRYLPEGLGEKILAQSDRIEGENNFAEKTLNGQRKWISYGEVKSRREMLME